MNPYNVLVKPLLSEKSNRARESANKYSFKVDLKATKGDVRKAIETLFDVKVSAVQTLITRGKIKRRGNQVGHLSNTKKAIVTLVDGAKIGLFDAL
ncbi:MAG: 50S ribosomal protein L23 [Proteobacteria bacterium]|nr:50S ribosomal protein L23 [Pseudomonadota bacterium]